jgi:hypothetical protein
VREKIISTTVALGTAAVFLFLKLSHLVFRFGDGNAYIYMAYHFGKLLPYRDFFLADPPFLIIVLKFFKFLFGRNLILFQAVPAVFEALTAVFLYLLLKKWKNPLSFLAPAIYLFSFTVLSTSDYLTGVQLVVFLSVLAIWAWENGWTKTSGAIWGLAVSTKLYIAPAFVGFAIFSFLKSERKVFWKFLISAIGAAALISLPFVLISLSKAFRYLIIHQLNRPAGLEKVAVLSFFLNREWFLLILALAGFFVFRKWVILAPFIFILVFFLLYADLYYLYLDNFMPYLIILSLSFLGWLWTRGGGLRWLLVFVLVLWSSLTFTSLNLYLNDFATRGRFLNSAEIADYIKTLPEDFKLYGSHEVAPLVALRAEKKLFDNQIDTNAQVFSSGGLNLEEVSKSAAEEGIYLLARIVDRPEEGITNAGYEGFFSQEEFKKSCQRLKLFPSTSNESDNFVGVFRCKSN